MFWSLGKLLLALVCVCLAAVCRAVRARDSGIPGSKVPSERNGVRDLFWMFLHYFKRLYCDEMHNGGLLQYPLSPLIR